ncbi:Por secretion system C-terminal sorting domain-containing protein [Tenacibaculum sp. MAR_2009_124]|uniref:GEVED domain-containing protein n=1 Tax=Tenacibaculum sp. MAR_2009_124 TaxID=1250059 RepID=UPI000895227D|nr:GEVED domain-containing protein [Tenacibaculum sp. MAR_2009_124]SEC39847.1 Por secretion system C-terminal sorting domain-containing protein [Tenacibaculum sp. MAR_2009_124]
MRYNYLKNLIFIGGILGFGFQTQMQSQNKQEIKNIRRGYDLSKLKSLINKFKKESSKVKKEVFEEAKRNGWKTQIEKKDGSFMELQRVVNGKPIYYTTFNVDAAKSTRTNHLHSEGSLGLNLLGQGMTAHVWDGGLARMTHQEYDGAGGNDRFSIGDSSKKKHYHAAHVTGTIIASGVKANAKGMAPYAKAIGYDWEDDKEEVTNAASNGMLISNHSYGYAARNDFGQVQLPQHFFGGYIDESRAWDEILFTAPNYLMVVAAGNDGDDNTANDNPNGGFAWDKLTGAATSKNNLVVANAQDANIDANGNLVSVLINSSSSEGPTDDFRINPDIAGNGTKVYSTYDNSDTSYKAISGTSMASPNVTGSLVLLQQHYKNLNNGSYMKAATLKGLVLHTADDAGVSGPDAVFGWGLLNTKKAAETITERGSQSQIKELTLQSGESYTITVNSDGVNPLFASVSWTDRPGEENEEVNSTTPVLVNDLDLRVTKGEIQYLPYKLTGPKTNAKKDNNVDPFERVDVNAASGTYTIKVTHKGNLTGASQNFTLIVTGISDEPIACSASIPSELNSSNVTSSGAVINWNLVQGATYDVRFRKVGSNDWIAKAVSGISVSLTDLSSSTKYEVQVRSKCFSENSEYSSPVNFTTSDITISYCNSKGNSVKDEYIQRVKLGSIDNSSEGGTGYTDFTSKSTNLNKGKTYSIAITPKWTGNTYAEGYGVYIDYNKDGDFEDENEIVWTKEPTKTAPVMGSFKIPNHVIEGETRMRIVMQYNESTKPCGVYKYGETEDYTVRIKNSQIDTEAPTIPQGLVVSNVTQTSLELNWKESTDNIRVIGYDVYQGTTKVKSVVNTTANITGLMPNTSYSFSVKAKDAEGNFSTSSDVVNVKTADNSEAVYCESKGKNSSYEWIDYVSFGGMFNESGNDNGYKYYENKIAEVQRGSENNNLKISAGFGGKAYKEYWAVWIDFNKDGNFDDDEKVISEASSSANHLGNNVRIPSNAILGTTRMRVSMKWDKQQGACETFSHGEVEDYNVNIVTSNQINMDSAVYQDPYFIVYPNPVIDFVNINTDLKLQNATYKILNKSGNAIQFGKIESKVDVSSLSSGIYILEVSCGNKRMISKLIKK